METRSFLMGLAVGFLLSLILMWVLSDWYISREIEASKKIARQQLESVENHYKALLKEKTDELSTKALKQLQLGMDEAKARLLEKLEQTDSLKQADVKDKK